MRLWRENRTDQEWTATDDELVSGFLQWADSHLSNLRVEMQVRAYLVATDGAHSAFEEPDFQAFCERTWGRLKEAV